ncbi:MAG: bifunctional 5,10-methylenetetrahydrofolate dehydrogenase/5,10-methenyltetrahydrofolate cyclohydrolase [Candidatus Omnitrophica bacterium]|nr:bifunctional 5,10-methylenetetrahydrofolate dehydrogenase/5,10-methenyltetrahydrofolate cyclohydrolase [Candidatus Omnitrophota bacterium]
MAAALLEGKKIAAEIREDLKARIEDFRNRSGAVPSLATIQVGENPAAAVYLRAQQKTAEKLGINFKLHKLDEKTNERELIDYIDRLNKERDTNGILIQMPLPSGINAKEIPNFIDPAKDVEGMHPENLGKVLSGKFEIAPCTAMAAFELIKSTGIKLYGKEAVIVGHSEIVGKPVTLLLLNEFVTVTTCHIGTGERGTLPDHVKRAEILVVAVGKAGLVKGEWIKEGAVVIDVGINRVGDKLVGDVEFEGAEERAAYITPVPGGVGPLTVTILMKNVVEAFRAQKGI